MLSFFLARSMRGRTRHGAKPATNEGTKKENGLDRTVVGMLGGLSGLANNGISRMKLTISYILIFNYTELQK